MNIIYAWADPGKDEIKLFTTAHNYNYWIGTNTDGKQFYNLTPVNDPAPNGGYFGTDYICKMKGVPNLFPTT